MKKLFTAFALLFILGFNANAQWQPSSGCCIWSMCFAVSGDSIFAGTYGSGVYLSPNNGHSWFPTNTGLPTYTYVYALANKGDTIFAGTGGGIYMSSNGGGSWVKVSTGLTDTVVYALAISNNNIFAGTEGGGVFLSTNNGGLWTAVNTGLTNNFIRALAVKGDTILAGTNGGYVFLTTNNGGHWTATSLTDTVLTFAISGNNIFAGTMHDGIYLSSNGGSSWAAVNTGLTDHHVTAIVINGNNIFAGTEGVFSNGYGVFMSSNNGSSWAAVNIGLNDFWALNITALAINKDTLFSGTDSVIWKRPLSELTGMKEIHNIAANIMVYPNPASEEIQVSSNRYSVNGVEIYNMLGERIYNLPITDNHSPITVNIAEMPSGVYVVEVKTEKGVEVKKFVKG